ncbi:MAG: hypothetical protein K6F32_01300, partial [Bacilli bacterium]|nr:hypothetical protein [Bacilli bacterium]
MKFRFTSKAIIPILVFLFSIIFLILYAQAVADPMGHYPKAHENTKIEEAIAFIMAPEHTISFVFAMIFGVYGLLFALDLCFRQKSSHILMSLVGAILVIAHNVTRAIWCSQNLNEFSKSIPCLAFFGVAALAACGCVYSFTKKSLDGDADLKYWIFFGVAVAAGFFAGMSRYSLLDSFGNGNSPVFWGGYASTRFSLLILVAACL